MQIYALLPVASAHFLKIVKIFIDSNMKISLLCMHMNTKCFKRRYLLAPPRRLSSLSNEKNMEMFLFLLANAFTAQQGKLL